MKIKNRRQSKNVVVLPSKTEQILGVITSSIRNAVDPKSDMGPSPKISQGMEKAAKIQVTPGKWNTK